MSRSRSAMRVTLGLLACLWAASAAAGWTLAADLRNYSWTDSDGRKIHLASLPSPLIVMTMAYTGCRRVCGTTTLVLSELQTRLDAMKVDADFVVVSYDPDNDSPEDWRDYRTRRHLTRGNWHFLTGGADATRKLARGLDLDFWTYHDHIVHDFRIVFFDSKGDALGEVDWTRADQLQGILEALPQTLRTREVRP